MRQQLSLFDIGTDASFEEVKRAYRQALKVWHPDRFGSDDEMRHKAEEKTKELNDAYSYIQSHWARWEKSGRIVEFLRPDSAVYKIRERQNSSWQPVWWENTHPVVRWALSVPFRFFGLVLVNVVAQIVTVSVIMLAAFFGWKYYTQPPVPKMAEYEFRESTEYRAIAPSKSNSPILTEKWLESDDYE